MSDTVKLIIEIPKAEYERLVYIDHLKLRGYIENGTPLEDVKTEITSKHFSIVEKNDFDNGRKHGYDECLSILDNIGKGDSE